jgi:hypothetical protein
MKKLTTVIIFLTFFTYISEASLYQAQPPSQAVKSNNTKTVKKPVKKDVKKVPHRTTTTKKSTTAKTTNTTN